MIRRSRFVKPAVLAAAFLLAACASPTGSGAKPAGGDEAAGTAAGRLAGITAELSGLDPEARRAKLLELAQAEGKTVSVYGSTNYDTSGPLLKAFEKATGIKPSYYRGSSSDVLQRVMQETSAGKSAADVMFLNGTDMVVLDQEKLLQTVKTPVAEELLPTVDYGSWFGFYVNAFAVGWNTDRVKQPPTSWEQIFTDYPGRVAFELSDWDWFATLVKDYFMAQKGMSEADAVAMFRTAARQAASIVDGHTLMAQLLVAGEYDLGASLYTVNTRQLEAEGAPMGWEPAVQPLILRPNGIGIHRDTRRPATALLFLEYMLTDAQKLLPALERDPVNTKVEGGLPPQYKTLSVPVATMLAERKKWESLYEDIIREAGKKPVTK